MKEQPLTRREACRILVGTAASVTASSLLPAHSPSFQLRYILGSCMYGKFKIETILPEVKKVGAKHIDIWPAVHGNQREQVEAMGQERFAALLKKHTVKLGIVTRYDLGPFGLREEMKFAKKLGGRMLITGSKGPRNLKGKELKSAVEKFLEQMKPHVAAAEEHGITIGIENHGNSLICSPDSQRWLADLAKSKHLGVALAPYHLPQDATLLEGLIEDLGSRLVHFYAWQHGKGCHQKLPKKEELLQMPGRGPLDFTPLLAALKKIQYQGWTEIFMHPVPRGIPILESAAQVTSEINRARRYLEGCLKEA